MTIKLLGGKKSSSKNKERLSIPHNVDNIVIIELSEDVISKINTGELSIEKVSREIELYKAFGYSYKKNKKGEYTFRGIVTP